MKLLFIHGPSFSFYYQMRHFRNSTAIDLPGHPSGKPCSSVEGYVEWVRGFIAARRYRDVVLCGHSMGGAIAMLYALEYPEDLKGIVLVGSGARLRVHPKYLQASQEGTQGSDDWLEAKKAEFADIEPDAQQALIQRAAEIGPAVRLNDLICCDKFDTMDRVHEISVPTLLICGSEDVITPLKYTDYLADRIPGAQKAIFDGASHYVTLERHGEVNDTIQDFLRQLKRQTSEKVPVETRAR